MPDTPKHDAEALVPEDEHDIAFVQDLVKRGEAVPPAPDGSVPRGATHVIVGKTEAGHPIVKRVRFSAY